MCIRPLPFWSEVHERNTWARNHHNPSRRKLPKTQSSKHITHSHGQLAIPNVSTVQRGTYGPEKPKYTKPAHLYLTHAILKALRYINTTLLARNRHNPSRTKPPKTVDIGPREDKVHQTSTRVSDPCLPGVGKLGEWHGSQTHVQGQGAFAALLSGSRLPR